MVKLLKYQLYEPISSQGNFSSVIKSDKLNLNTKPEHPLPVPLKEKNSEKMASILYFNTYDTFFV